MLNRKQETRFLNLTGLGSGMKVIQEKRFLILRGLGIVTAPTSLTSTKF